ncbi:MAG: spore coat protein [Oscillospiraceae bacterium]
MVILTQKETELLNDLKAHENLCIEKYQKYANNACDAALKTFFTQIAAIEQQHLNSLNQIASGTLPSVGASAMEITQPASIYGIAKTQNKENDCYLCTDALDSEKYVSSMYNTCIFEFKDVGIRNVLNHIQKEEQEHGEKIYNYMSQNSMY